MRRWVVSREPRDGQIGLKAVCIDSGKRFRFDILIQVYPIHIPQRVALVPAAAVGGVGAEPEVIEADGRVVALAGEAEGVAESGGRQAASTVPPAFVVVVPP